MAAVGLALGVAAMILSLAVISGFQSALRGELLGRTPQIEADLPPGADAEAARAAAARVPGVISVQIQVRGGGWLVDRGKVQAVELVGFDGRVPRTFPGAEGRPEGLYVPGTLAARWGLAPGAVLDVVSPRPTLTPLGPNSAAHDCANDASAALVAPYAAPPARPMLPAMLPMLMMLLRPRAAIPGAKVETRENGGVTPPSTWPAACRPPCRRGRRCAPGRTSTVRSSSPCGWRS